MNNILKNTLKHPSLFLVAGILFVGGIVWYNHAQFAQSQRQLYSVFGNQYASAISIAKNLSSAQTPPSFSPLFTECAEQNEFDRLLGQDSKFMDAETLTRALNLHALCSTTFRDRRIASSELLSTALDNLRATSELIENGRTKLDAQKVITAWETVQKLEEEQTMIHARNIELQREYWEIELQKVEKTIPFDEREEAFGIRNTEARANNKRMLELDEKIRAARDRAEEAWDHFQNRYLFIANSNN